LRVAISFVIFALKHERTVMYITLDQLPLSLPIVSYDAIHLFKIINELMI